MKLAALVSSFLLIFSWQVILPPTSVFAVEYQSCTVGQACNIGEFLYDDDYQPITTATCNITSRYPDGTLFINNQVMALASGGRYYYNAAVGNTQGIYPTQVCCTSGSDYMCIDKTFKVVPAVVTPNNLSPAEIWNYGDRSLTSFGNLVSDIWGYSNRTISNMGDLIAGVWSSPERTITNNSSDTIFISNTELREISAATAENRVLLEQVVNKPVIKTFIDEDSQTKNLNSKIQITKSTADQVYSQVKNLKSRTETLSEKWESLETSEIKSELDQLSQILKQDNGVLASASWLEKSWNSLIIQNLKSQANTIDSKIQNLQGSLNLQGKSHSPGDVNTIIGHINLLDVYIGSSVATENDLNLYGFIKSVQSRLAILEKNTTKAKDALVSLNPENHGEVLAATNSISTEVISQNQVPSPETFLNPSSTLKGKAPSELTKIKNKLLGLLALINTNKSIMASNAGQAVNNNWMEEGSMVFRTVASNPSTTLTQTVEVKIYLPTEVKKEQIISYDSDLSISYDPIEDALYAAGNISLSPEETRTFLVETEDIWNFSQAEIDIIKNQASELTESLKGSSVYSQASGLKTDINVALDKIILKQKQAITPENRIKTYRESSLELAGAEEKINSIKQLIAQSGGQNNLLGFVGGVQIVAIWGIIIIVIAGFIFLALYMKALRNELQNPNQKATPSPIPLAVVRIPKHRHREVGNAKIKKYSKIASIVLLASGAMSLSASSVIRIVKHRPLTVLGSSEKDATVTYPYTKNVYLADNLEKVSVKSAPSISAYEAFAIKQNQPVYVFKKLDNWLKIGLNENDGEKSWWIDSRYTQNPNL